jgi:hypothetical protein
MTAAALTPSEIAKQASDTLSQNITCLVAQYFKRHPDTKPENIEVRQSTFVDAEGKTVVRFWIHKLRK